MEVIRISAVWCSSCLVMKSRVNEVASELNIKITEPQDLALGTLFYREMD